MALDILGIDASRASAQTKTGIEWYSRQIIRAMAEITERPALRLYQRDPERFIDEPNVDWVHIERSRLWTHIGLANHLRGSVIDALFVPAHVIPWLHPKVAVATVHDLGYIHEPDSHTVQRRMMLGLTTRWNARTAKRLIVPSDQTRSDLQRAYGVDPSAIDVIPHGVDHQRFRPLERSDMASTLREYGVNQPYILFVSTIQPRKNLTRLISAFEALEHPELTLVIAGALGWKADPIVARFQESSVAGRIKHLGYVPDDLVPALYNGAEAFILPSLYEGFGMGVLEAMACGCPVVTSNTTSLSEVAGDAAVGVDPHSVLSIRAGIERALDPECTRSLRVAGRRRAAQFTWRRAAEQTLSTIRHAYGETVG